MNMRLPTLAIILGLIFVSSLGAQDIQFSHYNLAPQFTNPALTGSEDAQLRALTTYRNQWSQVLREYTYNLYAFSLDSRKNLANGNYIGFGLTGQHDGSGEFNFGITQSNLSIAFGKRVGQSETSTHHLVGGAQFGIAKRRIKFIAMTWPTLPGVSTDFLHLDVNAGLTWMSSLGERKSFYIGVATHHLNRPNISFFSDTTSVLPLRTTLHGGAEFPFSAKLSAVPSFIYLKQGDLSYFMPGLNLRLSGFKNNGFIQAGISYRDGPSQDALIIMANCRLSGITIGASYDHPLTQLRQAGVGSGALELTLGYVLGQSHVRKAVAM